MLTLRFWSLVSPWAPALILGPLAVLGLGTVGALLSALLREWPRRPLRRFLLGASVGTSFCVAAQLGLFQRG